MLSVVWREGVQTQEEAVMNTIGVCITYLCNYTGWCRSRYTPTAMCGSHYTLSSFRVHEFEQLFIDCTLCAEVTYVSER